MTAEMTDNYRYRTRRELISQAWAAARDNGAYPKLLRIQLLHLMVVVTFWALALMGGAALGWKAHQLSRFWHYGSELNGTLIWTMISSTAINLFGVIGLYAALVVIRHDGKTLSAASEVVRDLHWRYLVGFVCVSVVRGLMSTCAMTIGIAFAGFAIAARNNFTAVVLIAVLSVLLGFVLMCWVLLTYSQAVLIMRDRIEHGGDWTVFTILRESRRLMRGYRVDLIQLYLSMWWLYLVNVISLGIGTLFTMPVINLAVAAFYDNRVRFESLKQELKIL